MNPNSGFDWGNFGGGVGDILGGIMGMATYRNPANSAMPYFNQIPGVLNNSFSPYMQAGASVLPSLQQQYGQLTNNPGQFVNNMGKDFQQSPGFQFQTNQALNAANRAAAAGGMLGAPAEQQNIATTVNGLANQDYYNWLNHSMNAYGMGLSGMQGMAGMGLDAANNYGTDLSQALMNQAQLAYTGQQDRNKNMGGSMGSILSGIGSFF